MPSPVNVVFNADTGQFVSSVDGATKAVVKQAEAVASAKNKILESFRAQIDAAKKTGASAEELARIQTRGAESLANVTEKNAGRVIAALDRIADKQKRVAQELQALGDLPIPEPKSHGDDITNKQRASALLRGGGIRAGESFLTQFDAFNKLSTMVFPVLGISTLALEGWKAVEAFQELYETAEKLPTVLRDGFESINAPLELGLDNLHKVNDQWELTDALLHHKSTGKSELAIQLDEARIGADELASAARSAEKSVAELLEKNKSGWLQSWLFNKGDTGSLSQEVNKGMADLADLQVKNKLDAHSPGYTPEKQAADAAAVVAKQNEILKGIRDYRTKINGFEFAPANLSKNAELEYKKYSDIHGDQQDNNRIADGTEAFILGMQDDAGAKGTKQDHDGQDKKKQEADKRKQQAEQAQRERAAAARKAMEAQRKAAEDQRKGWDEEHDDLVTAGKVSAADDWDFWTGKVYAVDTSAANYKTALDKQAEALKAWRASDLAAAEQANAKAQKDQTTSWDLLHDGWVAAGHRTAEDERLFWELRMAETVDGGENYRRAYDRVTASILAAQKEAEEADKARAKAGLEKGQQQTAMAEAILGIQVMTGAISRQDAALQQANIHAEQYRQKMAALSAEFDRQHGLDPASEGTVKAKAAVDQTAADRQVQIAQDAAKTAAESWEGALRNANALWVQDSQDSARQVVALYQTALDGVNQNIVSFLTNKHGNGRHTTHWKDLGEGLAKQGTGDLLKRGESAVLSGLGLAKADGSRGNPFHVIVDSQAGGVGGAAGGALGAAMDLSGNKTASAIAALGSGLSFIPGASLLSGIFGGHRALGGGVKAGVTYDVGEMGREQFTPDQDGTITPNNRMGNGAASYTVQVANGVTPEAMKMHVREALKQFHPVVVASAVKAVRSDRGRSPASRS